MKNSWDMTDLHNDYEGFYGNTNVIELNINYLKPLKLIYDRYMQSNELEKAKTVRQTAMAIVKRTQDEELVRKTDIQFKSL